VGGRGAAPQRLNATARRIEEPACVTPPRWGL
jgi:hypothetical protein